MLKVIIVLLLIGVVISLFSGLVFLFKDTNREDSKRTLYALGIRITLATALVGTITYGVMSGELRLGTQAPWHDMERHDMERHDKEGHEEGVPAQTQEMPAN